MNLSWQMLLSQGGTAELFPHLMNRETEAERVGKQQSPRGMELPDQRWFWKGKKMEEQS